jgi:hypothetical protein
MWRLALCLFVAACPFVAWAAIRGSGSNRAFFLAWLVGVLTSVRTARTWCDQIVLSGDRIAFRCVWGTVEMAVSDVHAVTDQPAGTFTTQRISAFVTANGVIEPRLGRITGIPALVEALVEHNPRIRLGGPAYERPAPLTPLERTRARYRFQAFIFLSVGWAACGAAFFGVEPPVISFITALIGLAYVAVALGALVLARRRADPDRAAPRPDVLRSEDTIRTGLRAYGRSERWTTVTRGVLIAAPLIPPTLHWFTSVG